LEPRKESALSAQLRALAVVALLVVAAAASIAWSRPPAPLPATAAATTFSAARALEHVEAIAKKPHPLGSAADADVRAYLLARLAALGIPAEVQEATVVQTRYGNPADGWPAAVGTVKNVVARTRGTQGGEGTPALLLMAHYDSVSMAPGASDDGAGVATLLETARALAAQGPTVHDVIFLFTEGEEDGLLGARAFIHHHRWKPDVRMVLNFEARGDRGPVFMFQTTGGNGALVRALAGAVAHPMGASITGEIYKRLPNDTDLTEWLATDVQGMNFANIAGFDRYHSPTDTPANLDRGTLQQHGDYAVAMARRFADGDLSPPREPDAVFFDLGPLFVRYPASWAAPLSAAALALALALAWLAVKRGHAKPAGLALGATLALLPVILATLVAWAAWVLLAVVHADYTFFPATSEAPQRYYFVGFAALGATVALLAYVFLLRRLRVAELAAGTAVVWGLIGALLAFQLPAAAYLVTVPLLFAVVPQLAATATARGLEDTRALPASLLAAAAALPLVGLFPLADVAMMVRGASLSPVAALVTAMAMSFAVPTVYFVLLAGRGAPPLLAAAAALLGLVLGAFTPSFDAADPRSDTLFYAVDRDADKAYWATSDAAPDAFTGTVLGGAIKGPLPSFFFLHPDRVLLRREVPAVAGVGDAASVVAVSGEQPGRKVLRVTPPPGADLVAVFVDASAHVKHAWVNGEPLPPLAKGGVAFYYPGAPQDGFDLALEGTGADAVKLRVVARTLGLPEGAGARPPELMPRAGTLPPWDDLAESDQTIAVKTFDL
jgi:hypothetical protein